MAFAIGPAGREGEVEASVDPAEYVGWRVEDQRPEERETEHICVHTESTIGQMADDTAGNAPLASLKYLPLGWMGS